MPSTLDILLISNHPDAIFASLGTILGPCWGNLGALLGPLGAILGHSFAFLGPSWDHLGLSEGHLRLSEGYLTPPWGHLWPTGPFSKPTWPHSKPSCGQFCSILGRCGYHFEGVGSWRSSHFLHVAPSKPHLLGLAVLGALAPPCLLTLRLTLPLLRM